MKRPRTSRWPGPPGAAAGSGKAVKWTLLFVTIGLVAGGGSILFHFLTQVGGHFFMDLVAGYRPPEPAGEAGLFRPSDTPLSRWILLVLPALGGVLSGAILYALAPEAEGDGADAAIEAYHEKKGFIRGRVPLVKIVTSTLTLTTGGSGGREGPIAQIGAGFGSFLATKLKLSERERRIMMAAGLAAGIGSIFRAPMAGALFAAEVLYRDHDLESEVIIPAGIASVVAYCVFCLVFGWGSLFEAPYFTFRNPMELLVYLVLALLVAGAGYVFVKLFYGVNGLFKRLNMPMYLKPALGGLLTGVVGFFLPQTLSFGYGFLQQALFSELTIPFLLFLALGKMVTTSFSIGSGGSGGVFGPSVIIGGALGGVVGIFANTHFPGVVFTPGAYVVVGMAGFFTAVSNTPVATILLVSEITGSYHLLLPSLLVCSVSYMLSKPYTLYVKQPKNRLASPAHAGDFFVDILQAIKVLDLMPYVRSVTVIPEDMSLCEFKRFFARTKQHYFPVVDENRRMTGIFSSTDIRQVLFEPDVEPLVVMRDIAIPDIICTTPEEDLNSVLKKFTVKNLDSLPVVKKDDPGVLMGMLRRREVISYYNQQVEMRKAPG